MKQWKPPSSWERAVFLLMLLQIVLGVIYGALFGPYLGLELLLYFGWIVLAVGFVFFFLGPYELRKKGIAKKGESCMFTTVLVDSGPYAVVRHPQILGFTLLIYASILISQHWSSAIIGVPISVWVYTVVQNLDKGLIEKFGDDYKRYIQKVPRMNPLVGVIRLLRCRKRK